MQRIVVYVHNEEVEGLFPLAERLRKQGASVHFRALKWQESEPADVHLTFKRYENSVRKFHADANLQFIEDHDTVKPGFMEPPNVEPVIEPIVEEDAAEPVVFNDDEPIVVTAGEGAAEVPTFRSRKRAASVEATVASEEPSGE